MEFNHGAAIDSLQHLTSVPTEGLGYNELIVRETLAITQTEALQAPRNQEEFQKFIERNCSDSMQRYTYIRLIKESHYETLFTREFDVNFFIILCKTFDEQVFANEAFNNATEQEFIVHILAAICRSPQFSFVLDFLEGVELDKVRDIVNNKLSICDQNSEKLALIRQTVDDV